MGGVGSGRRRKYGRTAGVDGPLVDGARGLKGIRAGVVLEVARQLPDMPERLRELFRKRNAELSDQAFEVAMLRLMDMRRSATAREGIKLSEINDTVYAGALLEIGLAGTKEERLRAEGQSREQIEEALVELRKLREDKAALAEYRVALRERLAALAAPEGEEDGKTFEVEVETLGGDEADGDELPPDGDWDGGLAPL